MATGDKKDPVYFEVKATSNVHFKLNLDPDLYSAAVLAKTGGTKTKPVSPAIIIPISTKYAIASNTIMRVFAKVERTVGTKTQTRRVPILIEKAKAVSIMDLEGDTIKLGHGATPATWTVSSIAGG